MNRRPIILVVSYPFLGVTPKVVVPVADKDINRIVVESIVAN